MSKQKLVGCLVEVAGETVGIVVSADTKTLLIRKGSVYSLDGKTDSFVAGSNAVFVDRKLVEDAYWIRILPINMGTESVDLSRGVKLIREFLDM